MRGKGSIKKNVFETIYFLFFNRIKKYENIINKKYGHNNMYLPLFSLATFRFFISFILI